MSATWTRWHSSESVHGKSLWIVCNWQAFTSGVGAQLRNSWLPRAAILANIGGVWLTSSKVDCWDRQEVVLEGIYAYKRIRENLYMDSQKRLTVYTWHWNARATWIWIHEAYSLRLSRLYEAQTAGLWIHWIESKLAIGRDLLLTLSCSSLWHLRNWQLLTFSLSTIPPFFLLHLGAVLKSEKNLGTLDWIENLIAVLFVNAVCQMEPPDTKAKRNSWDRGASSSVRGSIKRQAKSWAQVLAWIAHI